MPIQDYTEFFGEDFEDIIDQLEEEFPEQVETILDEIIMLLMHHMFNLPIWHFILVVEIRDQLVPCMTLLVKE